MSITAPVTRTTGLVSIVIPAKDEEKTLGATIDTLPIKTLEAAGYRVEVVVLDGHSKDLTVDEAERRGATVIPDKAHGKGAAVRDAIPHIQGDYVVMLDGDGTYATDAIPRLLEPLSRGKADIVMGCRQNQPGSMTGLHKVGNTLLSCGASILYGRRCPDVCTGMWGFRASALRSMPLTAKGFELEAELFSLASRLRLQMDRVPVDYLPRRGMTKLDTTDGIRIGWCLLRSRFRPLRNGRATRAAAAASTVMEDRSR